MAETKYFKPQCQTCAFGQSENCTCEESSNFGRKIKKTNVCGEFRSDTSSYVRTAKHKADTDEE